MSYVNKIIKQKIALKKKLAKKRLCINNWKMEIIGVMLLKAVYKHTNNYNKCVGTTNKT